MNMLELFLVLMQVEFDHWLPLLYLDHCCMVSWAVVAIHLLAENDFI